jgi:hypothetical protein
METKECWPFAPTRAASGIDRPIIARRIYVIAAAASLVLSLWGAWAQFVPNPDAALYLRSAELLANGRWTAAVATYGWPMYSAVIAIVMTLTGLKAFLAAQIVNALFAAVTTVTFIALVGRLANGHRLVVLCAAIVILLQPDLVQDRPSIIRDNGYLAFLILTLYLVARDVAFPSRATKLTIGFAIVAAGLFRIEGFFLAALVPIYYVVRRPGNWHRPSAILATIAAGLAVIAGLLLWTSGTFGQWLVGHFEFGGLANHWVAVANAVAIRLHTLKYDFLFPYGGGNSWGAYVGMTLGIATVNIVRAITIPLAILTVFAFFPKRLMPRAVNGFVLWFAFGQLPLLLAFTFVSLLLDKRYAVGMALVLDIPLAFLLAEAIRQWRLGSVARFFLPVVAVVLVAVWAFSLPRPSQLAYLKEAGQWIGQEAPSNAKIITNDARIAYFSGRPYGETMRMWAYGFNAPPTDAELAEFDYLILQARDENDLPAAIVNLPGKQLVRSFPGKDGKNIFAYVRNRTADTEGGGER